MIFLPFRIEKGLSLLQYIKSKTFKDHVTPEHLVSM